MDDVIMVFFCVVMPIVSVLFAEYRIGRKTSNMIDNTIENLKTQALETLNKPETGAFIQMIGQQLAVGMMAVGGKEIKGAIPKFKLNDVISMFAMKMLGGGNLGNLLGGGEGNPETPQTSNKGTVKSNLT